MSCYKIRWEWRGEDAMVRFRGDKAVAIVYKSVATRGWEWSVTEKKRRGVAASRMAAIDETENWLGRQ